VSANRLSPRPAAWTLAVLGALLVVTALAVAPAVDGAFTFDEHAGVTGNRAIHPGAPASAALAYRFSPDQTRPLFFISLWLDARLHGLAPRGFRTTDIALHLLCGIVVFLLLRRAAMVCRSAGAHPEVAEGAALAGTAIFLLHPLQSESVIYVWGRSGVLATLLALLALLAAQVRRIASGAGPDAGALRVSLRALIPAWTLLALALAAKEEAMTLPLVALAWWLFVEGHPARRALSAAAWLAAPVVAFVALRIPLLGAAGRQVHVRSIADNILGQGVVNLRMVALTLWPEGQSVDHAVGVPPTLPGLTAVAACVALLLAGVCGALGLRSPALRAACAGTVIYAVGTILYWLVPLPDLMSERRAYLPLFGAALALTCLLTDAGSRWWRRPASPGPGFPVVAVVLVPPLVIAAFLAPALHARARLWADPKLLWDEAERLAPATARPHINLGVLAADRGDMDGAAAEFDRAIALEPRNPEALYNRGRLRLEQDEIAGAEADLRASVTADPTVPRARINLAVALIRQGRLPAAEEQLRAALAIDPGEPRALTNLAEVLRATGRAAAAVPLYRQALVSDPGYAHAAARLGVALEEAGDRPGALAAYREYLARGPSSETDAAAVHARIDALEAGLAAPGSIR
jgi:Flp pilus assembly protein TadD